MDTPTEQFEIEQWCTSRGTCGGTGGGPGATAEAPATGDAASGALNVTRPAQISGEKKCRILLAGIDSVDFGMYVEFGTSWRAIVAKLAQLKSRALGTSGQVIGGGRCAVLPGGKPNYPFHVQYPGFQLYLSRKAKPGGETPNVFVSLNSQLLWGLGEGAAVELIRNELTELADGIIHECRMSRCDLTADLLVPGGMTDRFVREHAVTRVRNQRIFLDSDAMQTLYVGSPDSEISLRIYDKSAEILHSQKFWLLPLWGIEENADVWRFEFQLRRPILKAFRGNSLDDLMAKRGALWQCLTENWFSLRLLDNENLTRRPVHPLWQTLCECAERQGHRDWNNGNPRLTIVRQSSHVDSAFSWILFPRALPKVKFEPLSEQLARGSGLVSEPRLLTSTRVGHKKSHHEVGLVMAVRCGQEKSNPLLGRKEVAPPCTKHYCI